MSESESAGEKVSSPSTALPDVRALREQAFFAAVRRLAPDGDFSVEALVPIWDEECANRGIATSDRVPHRRRVTDPPDALEAALRSREGERAEPADVKPCGCVWRDRACVHGPAQPEEAAQRADFNAWLSATGRAEDYANGRDFTANDLREAWAAAQRATPSAPTLTEEDVALAAAAFEESMTRSVFEHDPDLRQYEAMDAALSALGLRPTPNDEKRAALADSSGAQEAR